MKTKILLLFTLLFLFFSVSAYADYEIRDGVRVWVGKMIIDPTITGATINSSTIGLTTPAAGSFTDILGDTAGLGTTTPAGPLHVVLTAGHPAIFGGDTLATVTGVTGTDADPTVLTVSTTNGIAVGDAVIVNSGTNATVGTYWCTVVVVDTTITLDRNASSGGAISAASVTYVNDPIVIESGSGSGEPRIVLPMQSDAVTPTLAFGDGDTGFYEYSDDTIYITIGGNNKWLITSSALGSNDTVGAGQLQNTTSITLPAFMFNGDTNTGLGRGAADVPCIISGGVPSQVWGTVVTLTAAQIKALHTTPITIVAACGANTWIELVSVVLTYDAGGTPYTIANADDDLVIEWADGTDATASIETTGFLDQGDDEIRWYPSNISAAHDGEASINQLLRIKNPGTAELADGDGVLDVRVTYRTYATGF